MKLSDPDLLQTAEPFLYTEIYICRSANSFHRSERLLFTSRNLFSQHRKLFSDCPCTASRAGRGKSACLHSLLTMDGRARIMQLTCDIWCWVPIFRMCAASPSHSAWRFLSATISTNSPFSATLSRRLENPLRGFMAGGRRLPPSMAREALAGRAAQSARHHFISVILYYLYKYRADIQTRSSCCPPADGRLECIMMRCHIWCWVPTSSRALPSPAHSRFTVPQSARISCHASPAGTFR
jgi:hypothetical protein